MDYLSAFILNTLQKVLQQEIIQYKFTKKQGFTNFDKEHMMKKRINRGRKKLAVKEMPEKTG